MATVTLGNIKLNWKGAYNAGTAYAIDDVVSYNGSSYVAKTATTGNLPTVTANWDLMSQAGTNGTDGTDLTSTLTTQGDIVYRDGSGLARLAAGTNGQVLTTGGSGANPSWGTVSSDYVLLSTDTITSSTASISRDVFTSDYKVYKVFLTDFSPTAVSGSTLKFRFRQSNADLTTSDYINHGHQGYWDNSSNGDGAHNESWNDNQGTIYNVEQQTSGYAGFYEVTVYGASTSTHYPTIMTIGGTYMNTNYIRHVRGTSIYRGTTNALSGITIKYNSTNISQGIMKIYGLK